MAYGGESPSASCITGIGIVSGKEVVIHADDSTREGRRLVSADRQEDRARARHRDGEPPARHPSLRFRRRLPAAAVAGFSRPIHGGADIPQSIRPVEAGREAACAGVRPLHRRRRVYSGSLRLQCDRARHRRRVSRRAAARARRDGRRGDGGGTRRRRNAHQRLRHLRLSRGQRRRGDPDRTRDRLAMARAEEVGRAARDARGSRL